MSLDRQRPLIQRALWLDGLVSLLAGLACLPASAWLAAQFGIGSGPVLALAVFMAGYGALMLWLAPRSGNGQRWPWGIVIGNGLWVVASVALALSSWITPTAVGLALLLGQAAIVLGLTELQYFGQRRVQRMLPA